MQALALLVIEVVPAVCEHLVEWHELDDFPLGQVRRLVDNELSAFDNSLERFRAYEPTGVTCPSPIFEAQPSPRLASPP